MSILVLQAKITAMTFHPRDRFKLPGKTLSRQMYECGVHAAYRQLNSKWGMKIFASRQVRDITFDLSQKVYQEGIGPVVKDCFECKGVNDTKFYGYIVEHVPYGCDNWNEERAEGFKQIVRMGYELGITDLHYNNVRKDAAGNYLIIDCSYSDHISETDKSNGWTYWDGGCNREMTSLLTMS